MPNHFKISQSVTITVVSKHAKEAISKVKLVGYTYTRKNGFHFERVSKAIPVFGVDTNFNESLVSIEVYNYNKYGSTFVTGSEKTAHFAQDFKIELLVLQDRVALCGIFFVVKVMRCGVLTVSVQSFLTTIVS